LDLHWINWHTRVEGGKKVGYMKPKVSTLDLNLFKPDNPNPTPKPTVSCRTENGQRFIALLDSGSVGNQIANYISSDLANRLDKQGVTTCNCNLARTCTVVGCFTSDKCITLRLEL
jgi:hypothetical protein